MSAPSKGGVVANLAFGVAFAGSVSALLMVLPEYPLAGLQARF